ncbi:ATP-binding protein [Streptomyces sp. BH106]|uniref:sensor histidine kinase n=1 Tax=Streptomyces sp. BH106 TaxID=3410409 RepID=UPI003CF9D8C9
MPDYSADGAAVGGRGLHRGKPASTLLSEKGLRQRLTLLAVAPTASVTAAAAGAYAACVGSDSAAVAWGAGAGATVLCGSAIGLAWRAARATARTLHTAQAAQEASVAERTARLRAALSERIDGIQRAAERIQKGEPGSAPVAAPPHMIDSHPLTVLEHELHHGLHATHTAVLQAATRRQLDAFTTIARRLQTLVVRALKSLDDAERIVEDPELLNTLFGIDHLITRIQRSVESIAVLGGAVPREIRHPVPLATVLRQSIAEIEQYPRVRVMPVAGGVQVRGHAAVETIHLIAELAENATRFSPPTSQVLIRSAMAGSGMVIEVEDRGLGMSDEDRRRMNELLAHPEQYDVEQQLKDGRTGLFVAAKIASRRGLTVRLEANMYAGTQAIVILPHAVLHTPADDAAPAGAQGAGPAQPGRATEQPAAPRASAPAYASAAPSYAPHPGANTPAEAGSSAPSGPPVPEQQSQPQQQPQSQPLPDAVPVGPVGPVVQAGARHGERRPEPHPEPPRETVHGQGTEAGAAPRPAGLPRRVPARSTTGRIPTATTAGPPPQPAPATAPATAPGSGAHTGADTQPGAMSHEAPTTLQGSSYTGAGPGAPSGGPMPYEASTSPQGPSSHTGGPGTPSGPMSHGGPAAPSGPASHTAGQTTRATPAPGTPQGGAGDPAQRPPLTQRTRRSSSHLAPELRHGAAADAELPQQHTELDGGLLARYSGGVQAARRETSRSDAPQPPRSDEHQEN